MPTDNQAEIFDVLKRALKVRGKTYAQLADDLHVSEPTVKRIFSERDCKFSRLLEIFHALDISATEVFDTAARLEDPLDVLSTANETRFAKHPCVFYFFVLLKHGISSREIKAMYNLQDTDVFLYGQELEKMGLALVSIDHGVRLTSASAFKINPRGPLREIYRSMNTSFVDQCYLDMGNERVKVRTLSRKMLPATGYALHKEIEALFAKVIKLARQDRLLAKGNDLETFKWLFSTGPAYFEKRMAIVPHRNNRHASIPVL